jgi:hypothetical protein
MGPLQADEIFACLDRHDVRYVLIGGLAAVLHGSPLPTLDADICPAQDRPNLERLATALSDLDARIRTPDAAEGLRFPHEAPFLADLSLLNLVTRFGDLDLTFQPSGTQGFPELSARATVMTIHGVQIAVASLPDIIRSKEAAGRPKDRRSLPVLRRLLDEIQRRQGGPSE